MAGWIITFTLLVLVVILLRMALNRKISLRLQYVLLAVILIIALAGGGCTSTNGKANLDANASLRGEYFDFALRNRLDYVPFFEAGDAPTDIAEYLFYAFAINLDNWGDDKGTMARDYVEKVIRDHFEVREITPTFIFINKHWKYDGVKYTAFPVGINDKPIYVLKNFESAVENNLTTEEPVFISHSASRPLSDYVKTAVRMNYRHIGWDSYTMDEDRIGFVANALIGALPEILDQAAVRIDNESIVRDYWEQESCIELVFE